MTIKMEELYTSGKYIYAVDALSGEIEESFGENGKVDLRKNLDRNYETLVAISNTPGVVYKDILIQGTRVHEGQVHLQGILEHTTLIMEN